MAKKRMWNSSNPLYRYVMARKSKSRAKSSVTNITTMARKNRSRRLFGRRAGRRASRSSTNSNLLMTVGASMLYGAGRAKLSDMTQQYLPRFAGQYTDEVVLGVAGWYLSKKGGIIGQIGKSALIIESASIGNQLVSGMLTVSAPTANTQYYV